MQNPEYPQDPAGDPDNAPNNHAAEKALLGSMMGSAQALALAYDGGVCADWFHTPLHERVFLAIDDLHRGGDPVNNLLVVARMMERRELRDSMDGEYIQRMPEAATIPGYPDEYIRIVRDCSVRRRMFAQGTRLRQMAREAPGDQLAEIAEKAHRQTATLLDAAQGSVHADPAITRMLMPGGSFLLDAPETPPALWGSGADVLWAEGEALLIVAPQGAGKTTLAFQLVRARMGLQGDVLGYPVAPGRRRVLYLAMDRPAQAQRAGARLFAKDDRAHLNEHLVIWKGPPPADLGRDNGILTAMCKDADADTVIIDSLKDAALDLHKDEGGAGWNRSRQTALAAGVQVIELHHNRKAGVNGGEPRTLADIYGSVWIPSGCGSIVSLYGDAGDPIVSFRHLKQPMNEIGPFKVAHDHAAGVSSIMHGADLVGLIREARAEGLTSSDAASALFETKTPTLAEREKARKRLEKLCTQGLATRLDGPNQRVPSRYYLAAGTLA